MQAFEILKNHNYLIFDVENRSYALIDANKDEVLSSFEKYKNTFELVLDSSNRLESYVNELNPLAYDIVEFSEKPIILVSSGAKNISEKAMYATHSVQIRIVREGSVQQIIRKYRMPLVLTLIGDEDRTSIPKEHVVDIEMQDAFMDAGIIRLEANGRIEVIKK